MRRLVRTGATAAAVAALAAGIFSVSAVAGAPEPEPAPAVPAAGAAPADPLAAQVAALQEQLERVPRNWQAWSDLGLAYVAQARVSADPALYAKAEGAFARSLQLRPDDNDTALTGQGALANARHEFADALRLADAALAVNPASPTAHAVRTDALVELGRYDEARAAAQRLLDLRPGADAYARASYLLELSGDVDRARELMQRALDEAGAPADRAFAASVLGDLAWHAGDLTAARAAYDDGLAHDPTSVANLAGRARVLAAEGDPTAALADLRAAAEAQPQPALLLELGELLEATGQADAAQEQYALLRATSALLRDGGQDVDTELALFEADHGDPAVALASAESAYRKRPDSVFAQQAYAWALHTAGRSRAALPVARASLRTGLARPDLLYRAGAVEAAAGDPAAARATLARALELNPAFSPLHAPAAAQLLAGLS